LLVTFSIKRLAHHTPWHLGARLQLFPFIIGREGRKKKEIEESTGAILHIPRTQRAPAGAPRQKAASSETITIKSADRAAVLRTKTRLDLLVSGLINSRSLDYTHFVSIPLQSQAIHSKLEKFQQQVHARAY
jgi:activating signal cointegrator complex subunit 1